MLTDFMAKIDTDVIGTKFNTGSNQVDNRQLNAINAAIRNHPVEVIGRELRGYMSDMEAIASDDASVAARAAGLEWTGGSNQD